MTRTVRIHSFGSPDVLQIEDIETPAPGAGEVRLQIHAIGINRTEITLRSGRSPIRPTLPASLGFEAAGVINALGPDVTGFAVGDRVALVPAYGAAQYPLYGEFSLAPARSLVAIPDGVTFEDAAATWTAFGTAWAALLVIGELESGQTVLIPAASSRVGLAAIQIANRIGARPIALTRSGAKSTELLEYGAEAVITTDDQDIVEQTRLISGGKGADLVIDPVAGATFEQLVKATTNGGRLVVYGAMAATPTVLPPFEILARDLTIRGLALPAITRDDRLLADMKAFISAGLADGSLRPTIAKIFPFAEIADAHRFMEAGHQVGKIVVTLSNGGFPA